MAFKDDMKNVLDKGLSVSKNAMDAGLNYSKAGLSKMGTAVQNFGDQSILRIEKAQFESKFKHSISDLGTLVFKKFVEEGKETISITDEDIVKILTEMKEFKAEVALRDDVLKA